MDEKVLLETALQSKAHQLTARHKSQILYLAFMGFLLDTSKKNLLDVHSEIHSGYLFKLEESTFKAKLLQETVVLLFCWCRSVGIKFRNLVIKPNCSQEMSLEDSPPVQGVYLLTGCYKWADLRKQE